ncbi:competence protein ComK [Sporosarcina sp. G11-34]|uniref:competence protein ComK n=1 Tax=Sporosarcina sp. G11-34 TaxID=2849605 RepID=UPI0022A92FC8|nr:competence protein ComK [Sporosarcina sp. G11-34]MCZ2258619.1 competence protein ComK [Sporosarcina sp. G11-34]
MKVVSELILNNETILFYPQFDEYGNLLTGVMEKHGTYLIDMRPLDLIDYNLRYYGTSLEGASAGTKMILGKIDMRPLVMNEKLGLYWFPSRSPSSEDCVWFALHHIKDYKSIGDKKTLVNFSNGSTIIMDISFTSLDKKVQRAYKLKGKVEGRTSASASRVTESHNVYHLNKKSKSINYEINLLRREKELKPR